MAKAINWSQEFYDEVMTEDSEYPKTALRLGSIYFDNGYYVKGEIVDVRVEGKVVRNAQIIGDMELYKIKALPEDVISCYKSSLQEREKIIKFLSSNYNQPVDEETPVTVVTYRNLPGLTHYDVDDPHMN